jgi:ketosteroid isomerase-like protein
MATLDDLVRDVFRTIEAREYDHLSELMTPDCDFVAPGFSGSGPEPVVAWMAPFLEAFPDIRHEIGPVADRDGLVAFELHVRGTHTAPLRGPGGEVPPTGRPLDLAAVNVWRVAEGRIVAYHIYFDQLSFLTQLGLMPEAAGAAG